MQGEVGFGDTETMGSAAKRKLSRPALVLIALSVAAFLSIVLFMTLDAKGSWSFVLSFRGKKLVSLVLVAYSVAVSTVLFQTVTNNRILTPSIMGFDALYVLIKTAVVFFFGISGLSGIDGFAQFLFQAAGMVVFAVLLYSWLFSGRLGNLHVMLLVGIIIGTGLGALSTFLQRMLAEADAAHIRVFGGGGGTITPEEIADLEGAGVERIYHPNDGMNLGLVGMIDDLVERARTGQRASTVPEGGGTADRDCGAKTNDEGRGGTGRTGGVDGNAVAAIAMLAQIGQ